MVGKLPFYVLIVCQSLSTSCLLVSPEQFMRSSDPLPCPFLIEPVVLGLTDKSIELIFQGL